MHRTARSRLSARLARDKRRRSFSCCTVERGGSQPKRPKWRDGKIIWRRVSQEYALVFAPRRASHSLVFGLVLVPLFTQRRKLCCGLSNNETDCATMFFENHPCENLGAGDIHSGVSRGTKAGGYTIWGRDLRCTHSVYSLRGRHSLRHRRNLWSVVAGFLKLRIVHGANTLSCLEICQCHW